METLLTIDETGFDQTVMSQTRELQITPKHDNLFRVNFMPDLNQTPGVSATVKNLLHAMRKSEGNILREHVCGLGEMNDQVMSHLDFSVNEHMIRSDDNSGYELLVNPNDACGIVAAADSTVASSTLPTSGGAGAAFSVAQDNDNLSQVANELATGRESRNRNVSAKASDGKSKLSKTAAQVYENAMRHKELLDNVQGEIEKRGPPPTSAFHMVNSEKSKKDQIVRPKAIHPNQVASSASYQNQTLPTATYPIASFANQYTNQLPLECNLGQDTQGLLSEQINLQYQQSEFCPQLPNISEPQQRVQNTARCTPASPRYRAREEPHDTQDQPEYPRREGPRYSTPYPRNRRQRRYSRHDELSSDEELERSRIKTTQDVIKAIPRGLSFDGKGHWYTFKCKFLQFSKMYQLSESDRFSCLVFCLHGTAGELFAALAQNRDNLTFDDLMQTFEQTYGYIESDMVIQKEFESLTQNKDESLQEWADRVQRLGCRAFKSLPANYEQTKVVDKFCSGLTHPKMGHEIYMHQPKTLPEALRLAKLSEATFKSLKQRERPPVPKVRYSTSAYDDYDYYHESNQSESGSEEEYAVQRVAQFSGPAQRRPRPPFRNRENKERAVLLEILSCIQRGLNISGQSSNSNPKVGQSRSDMNTRGNFSAQNTQCTSTQTNEIVCFRCGQPNHFARDCPNNQSALNQ